MYARHDGTGVTTRAASDTGSNNIATLHISSLLGSGWGVYIDEWDDNYPIPPGYTSVCSHPPVFGPGDLIDLCMDRGLLVQDTIKSDAADPPVSWDSIWVTMGGYGQSPDGGGVFTFYVQSGPYWVTLYAPGYFVNPPGRDVWISSDTIGGLGFEINRAHCRVQGTLVNVPLPLDGFNGVYFHGDTLHPGYSAFAPVDNLTGTYMIELCDGDWTVEAPWIPDREVPAPLSLVIGNPPDTSRTLNLVYTIAAGVGGAATSSLPSDFVLHHNYPNPFNPSTTIEFGVPSPSRVTIEVFNVLGAKVRTLVDEVESAGFYRIEWGGTDDTGRPVPTGVYLCRMRAGSAVHVRKMLLMK